MDKSQKQLFIEELAHFLVDEQVAKSIALQIEHERPKNNLFPKFACEWAKLRNASTLFGYPTYEEGIIELTKLLS